MESSIGGQPYASQHDALRALYTAELRRLLRKFPRLDFADERSLP